MNYLLTLDLKCIRHEKWEMIGKATTFITVRGELGRKGFLIYTEIMAVLPYPIVPDKRRGHCCTYFLTE